MLIMEAAMRVWGGGICEVSVPSVQCYEPKTVLQNKVLETNTPGPASP